MIGKKANNLSNLGYMKTEDGWKKIESSNDSYTNYKNNQNEVLDDYSDYFNIKFDLEDYENAENAGSPVQPKPLRRRKEESYLQMAERESIRILIIIALCITAVFLIFFAVVGLSKNITMESIVTSVAFSIAYFFVDFTKWSFEVFNNLLSILFPIF